MSPAASSTPFPHLHVSSAFSAHYGVSWPQELVETAAAQGAQVLACTDRDGLYGMAKHLSACLASGISPMVGVNLAVRWNEEQSAGRVVVLARGHDGGAGYHALVRLISTAHARTRGGASGGSPWVSLTELAEHMASEPGEGKRPGASRLLVLIGPDSDVGRLLGTRRYTAGRTRLKHWRKALPLGGVRVEVVSHLAAPGQRLSAAHAAKMFRVARELELPAVLTNAVRYASPDGAATADVLDAARALSSLDTVADMQPNGQGWLKSSEAMHLLAQEIVHDAGYGAREIRRLLDDTHATAKACRIDPAGDIGWGQSRVPEASVIGLEQHPHQELRERCLAGMGQRYPHLGPGTAAEASVLTRLDHELGIIQKLGFSSYFLTVAEVVSMIEQMNVRVAARGSGASSLVNHLLRISAVDPIEHDLIFERFLSQDRSTLPDIDIDVESARRHEVYDAIFARFGTERTTLMSMQNGYRARGAVRDAGMALGLETDRVDEIAKQLWRFSASSFREAMERMPELRGFSDRLQSQRAQGDAQLDLLVDLTERLDRLPRHISMHPCGVILSDQTLLDRTPVQPSGIGLPMSQFDKHDMDPMGLLKLDVLGVRMQSTIAYTIQEIERTTGESIDLEQVRLDDEPTFEMIRTTHTLGCFQIESPGQRELLGKLGPTEFNDLIIDISLFRPGPMKSDMVRPFLDFRHGDDVAHYPHPNLRPVLEETHGVTVFHEQVLRTFDTMTGCGLARADEFRRAIGSAGEQQVEAFFRSEALKRDYPLDVIDAVWNTLQAFGSFGFCKAHGAAFAVPTYHSAWLKTHHPEAFFAGILEHDPGMYPRRLMVAEARRLGIPVLPVDINRSTQQMRMEWVPAHPEIEQSGRWGIRLSLTTVSGLSAAERQRVVAGQPYTSLADIRDRARPSRRNLERLAELGALDGLLPAGGASRTDLVHHLQLTHQRSSTPRNRPIEGQLSFELPDTELTALTPLFPDPTAAEQVRSELDLTAMDITGHLMHSHEPYLQALGVTPAEQLLSLRSQTRVLIAGVRVATQTPPMRSGKRVVFISVDDGTGVVDTSFFTEAQHQSGEMLFSARLMLIEGTTRRTGTRAVSVQATRAWDLHQPHTLPDPDYLSSTRDQWTAWLRRDRTQVPDDVPHHAAGSWPVKRGSLPAIPVPHPDTWEMMPTPDTLET